MSLEYYLDQKSALPEPTVCDVFEAGAYDTWWRIQFSRSTPRMKIHETTVTQNLIYEMQLLKKRYKIKGFTLYESTDEKANGDDLELRVLHRNGKVYTYALQAKIIYHTFSKKAHLLQSGTYTQFKHYVGKGHSRKNQIDLLLKYAKKPAHGYIPLYLLYNYISRRFGTKGYARECFGCSAVSAYYLKANYAITDGNLAANVKFKDLHPNPAIPWQALVCELAALDESGLKEKFNLPDNYNIIGIERKQLARDPDWRLIGAEKAIQEVPGKLTKAFLETLDETNNRNRGNNGQPDFRPKFRIEVLGNDLENKNGG